MISTRFIRLVFPPLLAASSLSACAQMDPPKWPWEQGAAQAPAPARPTAEAPHPQPAAKPAAKPAPELKALRPAPRPAVDKEVVILTPAAPPKLVGLSEDETAELLGRPAEETAEPPGKIWLYKAGGCQLSVHLFPDMEKGGFYALDFTADGAKEVCLGKVAGERRKGSALVEESKRG